LKEWQKEEQKETEPRLAALFMQIGQELLGGGRATQVSPTAAAQDAGE